MQKEVTILIRSKYLPSENSNIPLHSQCNGEGLDPNQSNIWPFDHCKREVEWPDSSKPKIFWIQRLFLGGQILSYPLPGFSSAHLGDLRLRLRVGCWRVSDTFPPPRPLSRTYSPLCTPCLSSGPLHPDPLPTLWLPCTPTSARPAPRVARVQKPIWEPRPRGRPEDSRRRPSGECWPVLIWQCVNLETLEKFPLGLF